MSVSIHRAQLRELLVSVLRTDSDFVAFALDYFPLVQQKFSSGMDRVSKVNLLLESEDSDEILKALHRAHPEIQARLGQKHVLPTTLHPSSPVPSALPVASDASRTLNPQDELPQYVLHLSDLHFAESTQAAQWHTQLMLDLRNQMQIERLAGIVLSGDITNHATVDEFGYAQRFLERVCKTFAVPPRRLLVVPGNHDVNWNLTDSGQNGFLPYSSFHRAITGSEYPLDSAKQSTVMYWPEQNIVLAGFNSAWMTDRTNPTRAGLHEEAFADAVAHVLEDRTYRDCTKLAVWHHPPSALTSDAGMDGALLQQLAQAGFQLVLHGHIHRADNALFRYYRQSAMGGLEILTAGTFGAPTKELVKGYPFQYQVLAFRSAELTVHTRKREDVAGGWGADHRWTQELGQSPLSYYKIALRVPTRKASLASPKQRLNLSIALVVVGILLTVVMIAILVVVMTRSPEPVIIVVTSEEWMRRLKEQGADPKKLDSPEEFSDKIQRIPPGQLRYEVSTGKEQESNELLRWVLALLNKDARIIAATKYSVKQQSAWTARVTPQARALAQLTDGIDRKLEQRMLFDLKFPMLDDMLNERRDLAGEKRDLTVVDLGIVPPPGMVEIPAGSYLMGSTDGNADEKPVHSVKLTGYYLDRTEVTMAQYQKCVTASGCTELARTLNPGIVSGDFSERKMRYVMITELALKETECLRPCLETLDCSRPSSLKSGQPCEAVKKKGHPFCNVYQAGDRSQHPVNCVDWSQAAAYCKWAGKRLPTEEEWEYAARGTDGRKYPWGNEKPRAGLLNACGSECVDMLKTKGLGTFRSMYSGNDGWKTTAPVGSVKGDKSPFGVMDMGGNVMEWVQDWSRDRYPKSDGPTSWHSLRGGSWFNISPSNASAPSRHRSSPETFYDSVGFRCARSK